MSVSSRHALKHPFLKITSLAKDSLIANTLKRQTITTLWSTPLDQKTLQLYKSTLHNYYIYDKESKQNKKHNKMTYLYTINNHNCTKTQ